MTLDVLTPSPLKLAVRAARASADGQPPMFEVACRLTTPPSNNHSHTITSFHAVSAGAAEWTLWKTFEDFQALDAAMRAPRTSTFARMMVPVAFAPEHKVRVFFHKDGSGSFLEKRRKELDYYMQRILMLPEVGDFCSAAGAGSSVLAEFLHATLHVACHANVAPAAQDAALSPSSTTSSVNSLARGLRQLHVDMRRAYSPPGVHSASGKQNDTNDEHDDDNDELEPRSRKQCKHEIEEALLARGGESELRAFKKRASAFRKENDALCGARELVAFVHQRYGADRAFAAWLVVRFARSLRSDEQRTALLEASGLRDDDDATKPSDKLRRNSMDASAAWPSTTRKRSKKEVLARVEKLAGGDAVRVAAFKRAARALGNHQMATDDFVAFLNETFGDGDAQRILKLVVEVVPSRLQHELSDAVRP